MAETLIPVSLTVDLGRNAIEIATGHDAGNLPAGATERRPLEMGVRGRLLGIDFGDAYLAICQPEEADLALARTVDADVMVARDAAGRIGRVSVPRRGAGYEITFPSGNQ